MLTGVFQCVGVVMMLPGDRKCSFAIYDSATGVGTAESFGYICCVIAGLEVTYNERMGVLCCAVVEYGNCVIDQP